MIELVKYASHHKDALLKLLNNNNVTDWLYEIPVPYTANDAERWLAYCYENQHTKENFLYAVEHNNKLVGGIGLHRKFEHCYETGYWIGEPYWNKGYATEALQNVLSFAFDEMKIVRVQAFVYAGNFASEKVLSKSGFEYEGYLKKFHFNNGNYINSKLFAKVI